jgi:hypothetical protein
LNEIAKHQPIEHNGREPFAVGIVGNSLNEIDKRIVLFAETGIKVFSNFFGIDFESFVNACRNIDYIGIFFEREREVGQFAKKEIRFIGGSIFESYGGRVFLLF